MDRTYIDQRGYRRFADSNKLVHRYIAEKKLGRKLKAEEVVHHKDRDKLNNDPGNLHIFKNQRDHDRIHKLDALIHGRKASYTGFRHKKTRGSGCLVLIGILVFIVVIMLS